MFEIEYFDEHDKQIPFESQSRQPWGHLIQTPKPEEFIDK